MGYGSLWVEVVDLSIFDTIGVRDRRCTSYYFAINQYKTDIIHVQVGSTSS